MELKIETKKILIFEETTSKKKIYFRQLKEDEKAEKVKIYEQQNDTFSYILEGGNSISEITFQGYETLPTIISPFGFGFEEKSMTNFFKYKLENSGYTKIFIADNLPQTRKKKDTLYFTLADLEELKSSIGQEQRACNDTKTILVKNFLKDKYPALNFDYTETNNNKELVLRNLNTKLIQQLTSDDIENLGKFYVEASKKYSRPDIVKKMIKGLQKNAQLLTLQEVINKYEKLLKDNPAESAWQDFFNEYITLFDNRYYQKINYKNIALGITKYPDLVLVDIYGYLDFYELKKADTKLLEYDKDHKTYYWSKNLSMVVAQVADYLQRARENSIAYAKAIKEQTATEDFTGIEVSIINPRAIIVAGNSKELNTTQKQNHFKNLRESLKDIEFVLYDELLDRLKNLLEMIKI
ncbi:MAG: DUF4263 domain-containing protein [Saprospiraceae bacterium]|nr:DUF4263 domain-containing protein [Saprospiraceae bacterium]